MNTISEPDVERLKMVGMFSLEKIRLRGGMITVFKYVKGFPKEDGECLFSLATEYKTKGNG